MLRLLKVAKQKGIGMFYVMSEAATMGEFGFVASLPKAEERPKTAWDEWAEVKRLVDAKGQLIPINFAVKLLGVSRARVYQLIDEGKVETVEVGTYQFVTENSLMAWAHSERKAGRPFKPVTKKQLWKMALETGKEMAE
jgi:hypothetical protein